MGTKSMAKGTAADRERAREAETALAEGQIQTTQGLSSSAAALRRAEEKLPESKVALLGELRRKESEVDAAKEAQQRRDDEKQREQDETERRQREDELEEAA